MGKTAKKEKKAKKAKDIKLKTKRLVIIPMTDDEMLQLISETENEELRTAYQEMYDGSVSNAENRLFYVIWKICLNENDCLQKIGEASFKGAAKNYSVEIGYGIDSEYQGNGYMTEAAEALTGWAFEQEDVYFIEAETDPDNSASQGVLEKLGFKPDGQGEEGPRYMLEKPQMQWMPIYMLFGISIGISFGNLRDNMGVGMGIGIAIGMCFGLYIDNAGKKRRQEIREERNANRKKSIE